MDVMQGMVNQLLVSGELCGNMPRVDVVAMGKTVAAYGQYVSEIVLIKRRRKNDGQSLMLVGAD